MTNQSDTQDPKAASQSAEAPYSTGPTRAGKTKDHKTRAPSVILTLVALVAAGFAGVWLWTNYMDRPWTRDGNVRVNVVTVAPQVSGNIEALPIVDNQYVKKGELLVKIDQTDYVNALQQAKASLAEAQANLKAISAQIDVQRAEVVASDARVTQAEAAQTFASQQAARYTELAERKAGSVQNAQQTQSKLAEANAAVSSGKAVLAEARQRVKAAEAQRASALATISKAKIAVRNAEINLERTEIRSPVDGWVTNLLTQAGNFASAGHSLVSIVDAHSFWVDGYFEETSLSKFKTGDRATIQLMAHEHEIKGHVGSMARAISVPNSSPNAQGVATVNPIFTWVRLAQRIPVRIEIDEIPDDITLIAGMTATVNIHPGTAPDSTGN